MKMVLRRSIWWGGDAQRAAGGDQVEIRHLAPEQRVFVAEVVMDDQTRHHRGNPLARLVSRKGVGMCVGADERGLRHGVVSTRAATGCRLAWQVIRVSGDVCVIT